jgi:hypothetical protein
MIRRQTTPLCPAAPWRRLLAGVLAWVFASVAPAAGPMLDAPPKMGYNPDLLEARVLFDKTEYLVGEPAYWEFELRNNSSRQIEASLYPYYTDDAYCQVVLPGEEPFRYRGDDEPGMKQRDTHKMLPGEKRLFHFRLYYDKDGHRPHPTSLLFYEPTEAILNIAVHYRADAREQVYQAPPVLVKILEPAARNAECERLLRDNNVSKIIQRQVANPEEFALLEGILGLYSDTVYAPHLAFVLANGYLNEARRPPVNRELMRAAIRAYQTLLQVTRIPYIHEVSLYSISHCHLFLGDEEAFVAWLEKYLTTYGDEGRYVFDANPYLKYFEEVRQPDPGEHWNYYP